MPIHILYQDEHLLVVNKPVGLSSQDESGGKPCLPALLAAEEFPVKTVHRLDRETGGVMVYARTKEAAAALSTMVGQHERFIKEYLAVLPGVPACPEAVLKDLLYHDMRRNKSYTVKRERKGVRPAKLTYSLLDTVTTSSGTLSLIQVRLHTGRTHQIRVQFASRGFPLIGDRRYGSQHTGNLALFSCRLTFVHPFTNETIQCHALPDCQAFPWCGFHSLTLRNMT